MTKESTIEDLLSLIYLILDKAQFKKEETLKDTLSMELEDTIRLNDKEKKVLEGITDNLIKGYLSLAVNGYQFTEPQRIKEKYGNSLKENYPEASETFLRFAESYWTFKIKLSDFYNLNRLVAYHFLADVEFLIAALFFPTPGPTAVPSNERERKQREVLKDFKINIEDFIKGNPILIRDRRRGI